MAKKLSTSQLMVLERLLGKQCTLQGKPRAWHRTEEQNQKLGIPEEHNEAVDEIGWKNSKLGRAPRLADLPLVPFKGFGRPFENNPQR